MEPSAFASVGLIGIAATLLGVASISDIRARRISNRLTGSLALFGFAYVLLGTWQAEASLSYIAVNLGMAAAVLAGGFALFAARVMGGGDVKLLAAFALFAGQAYGLPFLLLTALSGGLVTGITLLASKLEATRTFAHTAYVPHESEDTVIAHKNTVTVPYGVAIAIAGWWTCFKLASQAFA